MSHQKQRFGVAVLAAGLISMSLAASSHDELWLEFAHPNTRHDAPPYGQSWPFPSLFPSASDPSGYLTRVVEVPVFVPLLEYDSLASEPRHDQAFFSDFMFSLDRSDRTGWPSVAEIFFEISNGRLKLVAATGGEASGQTKDGISEWNEATPRTGCYRPVDADPTDPKSIASDSQYIANAADLVACLDGCSLANIPAAADGLWRFWGSYPYYKRFREEKRREAIHQADSSFSFSAYSGADSNIDSRELTVIPIGADRQCEGHGGTTGPGGTTHKNANPTDVIGAPNRHDRTWASVVGRCYTSNMSAISMKVEVDGGTQTLTQKIAMFAEQHGHSAIVHELGHSLLGIEDLYRPQTWSATPTGHFHVKSDGTRVGLECPEPPPGWLSPMGSSHDDQHIVHFTPWTKIHAGFVKPQIVTHDGVYAIYDAETKRSFLEQESEPEALIIYDPLSSNPYEKYFILENRNSAWLNSTDPRIGDRRGLAIWLIDERFISDVHSWVSHRVNRLISPCGYSRCAPADTLWDDSSYDLTASSTPRNSNWLDPQTARQESDTPSYIEVRDISTTGPAMNVTIRMPPIFVNATWTPAPHGSHGSQGYPWMTIGDAIDSIPPDGYLGHDWHPRTIKVATGDYSEPDLVQGDGKIVIDERVTLMGWGPGSAFLGK
jgi:M6 family metalloprotease-like protein